MVTGGRARVSEKSDAMPPGGEHEHEKRAREDDSTELGEPAGRESPKQRAGYHEKDGNECDHGAPPNAQRVTRAQRGQP